MKTGISVGGKLAKKTTGNITTFIERVFEAGSKYHMEQETIRHALSLISRCVKAERVSINRCTITSEEPRAK